MAAVAAAIARLMHSDKGYGVYIALQFIIPTVGFYFLPGLLPDIGFNGMLLILIALEFIALLMVPVLLIYPLPASEREGRANNNSEIGLILQPVAILAIVGFCIYGAANAGIWAYAERIGLDVGLSGEEIGSIIAASNIVAIAGAFLVIRLQDKYGHILPLGIGIVLQFIAMLVLIFALSQFGYGLGIVLFQAAWAFAWPYFLSIQADIDSTGVVVVAGTFGNLLGNAAGPALAAIFVGSSGEYEAALWMCCGLFFASLIPMLVSNRLTPVSCTPNDQSASSS